MQERRKHLRSRSLKGASIAFNNHAASIDCVIRNSSESGACLEVVSPIGVPESFDLVGKQDGVLKRCRVVWRKLHRLGVEFAGTIGDMIRK
jgi:hypothetical protein